MTFASLDSLQRKKIRFQILGYLCGGMIPVFVFSVAELSGYRTGLIEASAIVPVLLCSLIGIMIGMVAILLVFFLESGGLISKVFFSTQAIFSFIFIHILVLYSGGPQISVFALTYLFLPTVIGYTYGKGANLYAAAVFLASSYTLLLFAPNVSREIIDPFFLSDLRIISSTINNSLQKPVSSSNSLDTSIFTWKGNLIYFIVTFVQLSISLAIARAYDDHQVGDPV